MVDQGEKQPDRDLLKLEYQECNSHTRFIVGIRFSYFVSFTTLFFALVGAFYFVWISEAKELQQLKPVAMLAIAGFGFYTVFVARMIEQRNIQLYRTSDSRAADLEWLMEIKEGIHRILVMQGRKQYLLKIPVTHTRAIDMFYRAVAIVWVLLVLFSIGFGIYRIWLFFHPLKEVCNG